LAVLHRGKLIYEQYFGAGSPQATPNLASVGKAFTSIAVGILMGERPELFPEGLDQKVYTPRYLPEEAFPLKDPRKAQIRLGHLLAMTSGLRGNTPGYVKGKAVGVEPPGPDGWPAMVDRAAFDVGMWRLPGEGYSYATAGVHVLSAMVRHVARTELEVYLEDRLAKPLGFKRWGFGYLRPEIRHTPGGGGVAIRARDMLKFGQMLSQGGRWGDRQIVPRDYVRQCGRATRFNVHYPYSFQFTVNTDGHVRGAPRDAFWKTGSGGHCLYVAPSLDLVAWKLEGRDEQYREMAWEGLRYDGSREGWKPAVKVEGSEERVLELLVEAVKVE
jgi:CubicO group peptidase (beta-lactamase class C family)